MSERSVRLYLLLVYTKYILAGRFKKERTFCTWQGRRLLEGAIQIQALEWDG